VGSAQLSLTGDLEAMRSRIAELEADNAHLRGMLKISAQESKRPGPAPTVMFDAAPGTVTAASPAREKVAFYANLFRARSDVYAVRWDSDRTGRGGWMPAVQGGFRKGVRPADRRYLPLTEEVVTRHLSGDLEIGLYPLLDNDRCHWLAADFDGSTAMLDALAYVKAARAYGMTAALEVSRSGAGAHVWVFFTSAVPAAQARQLGTGLLREAMTMAGRLSLASYDRLFPSQDLLPSGGIGNLIAAPLQGRRRRTGTTVFLELATLEPHEDPWSYLSSLPRVTPAEVTRAATRLGALRTGSGVEKIVKPSATRIDVPVPRSVDVELGGTIRVKAASLPPALLATLRHAASMPNPAFYDRERRRQSTWDTPRFLRLYDETVEGDLLLPRGMYDRLTALLERAGSSLVVTADLRSDGSPQELNCSATLTPEQHAAHEVMLGHDLSVLVAPPGAGKTVMASAVIASLGVSTLVLVDRKALADQWRTRLGELLGVKVGQRGGGRAKTTGVLDIATLQTLARDDDVASWTKDYGLIVVDECHHVPAAAYTHAVSQIPARRWLGLTATPYRRDQLDDLITLQIGPIRHTVARATRDTLTSVDAPVPDPVLLVHPTNYTYDGDASPQSPGGMATIYRDLVADDERLQHVVQDVVDARERGRHCLVLTQWTSHLERLTLELAACGHEPVVLRGGMGAKQRVAALAQLEQPNPEKPLLVVATGPSVGEGFDCPALDTLFLAAPIAFKGRLVQYVGRILRPYPGKTTAEVHDYHDVHEGVLASSLTKRAPGYLSLGFPDPRDGRAGSTS
jgi:superfamily II DNA or RNA helicase